MRIFDWFNQRWNARQTGREEKRLKRELREQYDIITDLHEQLKQQKLNSNDNEDELRRQIASLTEERRELQSQVKAYQVDVKTLSRAVTYADLRWLVTTGHLEEAQKLKDGLANGQLDLLGEHVGGMPAGRIHGLNGN